MINSPSSYGMCCDMTQLVGYSVSFSVIGLHSEFSGLPSVVLQEPAVTLKVTI